MVYLADPDLALKRLGHNSVERGMLDLLRPWFRLNVLEFEPYIAAHARFLVYGDFVRLSFLNWLLPELHARGWRTELLNRGGDNLLLLATRDRGTRAADPRLPPRSPASLRVAVTRDRQATMRTSPPPPGTGGPGSTAGTSDVPRSSRGRGGLLAVKALAPVLVVLVAVRVVAAAAGWANRLAVGWRSVLPPRDRACRGQRLQAAQRAGRDRGRAVPATAARRRRTSPVGSRDERPDNRRPMASPVVVPRLRGVRSGGAVVSHAVPAAGDVRCWVRCCRCSACMHGSCRTRCSPRSGSASRRCCS